MIANTVMLLEHIVTKYLLGMSHKVAMVLFRIIICLYF